MSVNGSEATQAEYRDTQSRRSKAMNRTLTLACLLALGASAPALAQQADPHQHAPAQAAAPAPANEQKPAAPAMERQLAAMHAMHQKMMAAKTPAERQALMAEHDKLMHEGMRMMEGMGMGMSHGNAGGDGACDMGEHQRRMAMHMQMMHAMMQMMMDRMPSDPKH
jgi:hypothetical protein